ncbi:MAG: hypothetical protein AAGM67_20760, partial [Bacteroidota bacterium]
SRDEDGGAESITGKRVEQDSGGEVRIACRAFWKCTNQSIDGAEMFSYFSIHLYFYFKKLLKHWHKV